MAVWPEKTPVARGARVPAWYVLALLLTALTASAEQPVFVTWEGIGPDKWASAWLLQRHIEPDAELRFLAVGQIPDAGIPFDIPETPPYIRDSRRTTYESLLEGYSVADPALVELGQIVRDIEVNYWGVDQFPVSPFLEKAFRGLQLRYGRENVPHECYFQLFDKVYGYLRTNPGTAPGAALEQALRQDQRCGSVSKITVAEDNRFVAEWRPQQILAFLGAGDRVVFVDTRESDEFEEGHIPGAVNIKLRDIGGSLPAELENADVVIPYCVKDFRGFEVAKRLKLLGAHTVGLMNPYGISGWRATGLPVAGTRALADHEGARQLQACVEKPSVCLDAG